MFLVRSARNTHLVDEDELRVTHPDVTRVAEEHDSPIGRIRRVEATGKKNRTHVWLFARETIGARGDRLPLRSDASLRGAESNKIVRRIAEQDLERLAHYDEAVEKARAVLKVAREERKEFVAKAWRRADKTVSAGELERLAARTEERKAAERAAHEREADAIVASQPAWNANRA